MPFQWPLISGILLFETQFQVCDWCMSRIGLLSETLAFLSVQVFLGSALRYRLGRWNAFSKWSSRRRGPCARVERPPDELMSIRTPEIPGRAPKRGYRVAACQSPGVERAIPVTTRINRPSQVSSFCDRTGIRRKLTSSVPSPQMCQSSLVPAKAGPMEAQKLCPKANTSPLHLRSLRHHTSLVYCSQIWRR
jgi:hypothetical protein